MLWRTSISRHYAWSAGGPQLEHYQRCLVEYGHAHKYMAFIDSDEVQALALS